MRVELYYMKEKTINKEQHRGKKQHGFCAKVQVFQGSQNSNYWTGSRRGKTQSQVKPHTEDPVSCAKELGSSPIRSGQGVNEDFQTG